MTIENSRYTALIQDMRRKLVAEFEASPELQNEFVEAENYTAYFLADAERVTGLLSTWRANFENADNLAAFQAAEAAGRVSVLGI